MDFVKANKHGAKLQVWAITCSFIALHYVHNMTTSDIANVKQFNDWSFWYVNNKVIPTENDLMMQEISWKLLFKALFLTSYLIY